MRSSPFTVIATGWSFLLAFVLLWPGLTQGQKIKLSSSVRSDPVYYLVVYAAEEKGFWRQQGLEVEWFPFSAGGPQWQAVSARSINVGMAPAISELQAAVRGVPVIIVSDIQKSQIYRFWVKDESPLKEAKNLKGVRIGLARLAGLHQAYSQVVAKSLGLEKEVKYIASGGIPEQMAMLRTGSVDVIITSLFSVLKLWEKGEVRELLNVTDFLPKEWMGQVLFARKDFAITSRDTVRRLVGSALKAVSFVAFNSDWSVKKVRQENGVGEEVARLAFQALEFTADGTIGERRLANVLEFLASYEIIPRDKIPSSRELVNNEFTPRG